MPRQSRWVIAVTGRFGLWARRTRIVSVRHSRPLGRNVDDSKPAKKLDAQRMTAVSGASDRFPAAKVCDDALGEHRPPLMKYVVGPTGVVVNTLI
jgi:hypothetical protein